MKLLEDMSDEDLLAEIQRINAIPIPKDRRPGQPPRRKEKKEPKARKPSWKDAIFTEGELDG